MELRANGIDIHYEIEGEGRLVVLSHALLTGLGLTQANWVGLSMGGIVGQLFALTHGDMLKSVVSGVFNHGVRDYPAGTFIHAPAGSSHVPQSRTGCTLFLFYPEG